MKAARENVLEFFFATSKTVNELFKRGWRGKSGDGEVLWILSEAKFVDGSSLS